MRVLLIGSTGRLGAAVHDALKQRHEVVTASRSGGDHAVDIRDPSAIAALYEQVGRVDAVACAAGSVPYRPLGDLTHEDLRTGVADKLPGRQRINAVSPTVFTEALDVYGSSFPGFLPVPLRDVAATYVRSVEGVQTGQVFELGQ